ncbi:MAG: ABC transporter permease [bacterium]|nr:ABC transporter permease [bacterium]
MVRIFKHTYTYKVGKIFAEQLYEFISTVGEVMTYGIEMLKCLKNFNTRFKDIMEQASRFGVSSLPITLTIVEMTSIIIAMQVAEEMVKHGGGNFVGMLIAVLTVREEGAIMAGFAIISMIGSSMASEIATMKVTDQIDALRVLNVNPVQYLFTPRVIAGTIMMPFVVTIASLFGIVGGAIASNITSELSYKAYFDSVWFGLNMHDINVCLLKSLCFGFAISMISCASGMSAKDGAKGVGTATTKAVVWSFVSIVIIDLIFAAAFFY